MLLEDARKLPNRALSATLPLMSPLNVRKFQRKKLGEGKLEEADRGLSKNG